MKYILELKDEPIKGMLSDEGNYYRCKQIPYWSIADSMRNKLTPYTEPDRKAIEDKVWNFVDFMIYEMDAGEREECFGESTSAICIHELTYQGAKAKYDEWLKQKDDNAIKQKVIELADEIGIHKLYAIVRDIRGE